jgi:hypothetical protein
VSTSDSRHQVIIWRCAVRKARCLHIRRRPRMQPTPQWLRILSTNRSAAYMLQTSHKKRSHTTATQASLVSAVCMLCTHQDVLSEYRDCFHTYMAVLLVWCATDLFGRSMEQSRAHAMLHGMLDVARAHVGSPKTRSCDSGHTPDTQQMYSYPSWSGLLMLLQPQLYNISYSSISPLLCVRSTIGACCLFSAAIQRLACFPDVKERTFFGRKECAVVELNVL